MSRDLQQQDAINALRWLGGKATANQLCNALVEHWDADRKAAQLLIQRTAEDGAIIFGKDWSLTVASVPEYGEFTPITVRASSASAGSDPLVQALLVLAACNIAPDLQELLTRGNPARGVAPKALEKALEAYGRACALAERERCALIAASADRPGRNTGTLIADSIRSAA